MLIIIILYSNDVHDEIFDASNIREPIFVECIIKSILYSPMLYHIIPGHAK